MREKMRSVRFSPYGRGMKPTFTLTLFDIGSSERIGHEFKQHDRRTQTIFEGHDFRPSPLHAWDSDDTIAAIMGFLTLRLGDTDREYFDSYTAEQIEFRDTHAETLACDVYSRFEAKEGA
jgi:hypothetical protein